MIRSERGDAGLVNYFQQLPVLNSTKKCVYFVIHLKKIKKDICK